MKGIIGDAVITCECGEVFRVPAYGMERRYAGWKYWLMFWKTPFAMPLSEQEGYPLKEHGMHLIKKVKLERKKSDEKSLRVVLWRQWQIFFPLVGWVSVWGVTAESLLRFLKATVPEVVLGTLVVMILAMVTGYACAYACLLAELVRKND